MDININNIIEKNKGNFTRPLSGAATPFPADIAREVAAMADKDASLYEELGGAFCNSRSGRVLLASSLNATHSE